MFRRHRDAGIEQWLGNPNMIHWFSDDSDVLAVDLGVMAMDLPHGLSSDSLRVCDRTPTRTSWAPRYYMQLRELGFHVNPAGHSAIWVNNPFHVFFSDLSLSHKNFATFRKLLAGKRVQQG